jgi:hypothetical protein
MRPADRPRPILAPAALLAVSVAVCLGSTPSASAMSERRGLQEHEQAVASLIACLEAAAKQLAGQHAALSESDASPLPCTTASARSWRPVDDEPVVALHPHLSRLNLPPPTPFS